MAQPARPLIAVDEIALRWEAWDVVALVALVLFAFGLRSCWTGTHGSHAPGRLRKGAWLVVVSTIGLMAYAWHRAELIFFAGELILLAAAAALLVSLKQHAAKPKPHAPRGFPVVAPDSAEWKVVKPSKGPSPAEEGISPPIS